MRTKGGDVMAECIVTSRGGGGGKKEWRYGWKKNSVIDGEPTILMLGGYNPIYGMSSNSQNYYVSNNIAVVNGVLQLVSPTSVLTDYLATSIGKYCANHNNKSALYKTTGTITKAYDSLGYENSYMSAVAVNIASNNIQTTCASDNANEYPVSDFLGGYHYTAVT